MSYMALYRKFRPMVFDDVKGQEGIVTTLQNQIKTERVGHAYLFCGTRGTGKTTIAKILAKAVNCENPVNGSPCCECEMCRKIAAGISMNVIEIDAASNNGVDNIREIIDEVTYSPTEGKYKVYIIDEVHMLSAGAFNALLKTLEEPPSYVIFILATTEFHKIPITILSRCQRYDFRRINMEMLASRMRELTEKEAVDIEEAALMYIAKAADGSMRDALSLLDQCIAFHYGERLTYEMVLDVLGAVDTEIFADLLDAVLDKNITGAIRILDDIVLQGRDLSQFVSEFTWYLRNLMLAKTEEVSADVLEMSGESFERLKAEAERVELNAVLRYIRIFSELSGTLRYAVQKRIMIEVAIIKLCRPQMETKNEALLERIRDIEKQIAQGVSFSPQIQGGESVSGSSASAKPKPVLAKAIPAEIQRICENWGPLLDAVGQPLKSYLRNVKVSLGAQDELVLVTEDFIAEEALNEERNRRKLKQELEDFIQKEIVIRIDKLQEGTYFEDSYVDIFKSLGMSVDIVSEDF